jgi:hypothetical protein
MVGVTGRCWWSHHWDGYDIYYVSIYRLERSSNCEEFGYGRVANKSKLRNYRVWYSVQHKINKKVHPMSS